MELVRKNLVMTFGTVAGKALSLTITKPKEGMTAAEIKTAMTAIVATNTLGNDNLVTSVGTAKYVVQQQEEIALS